MEEKNETAGDGLSVGDLLRLKKCEQPCGEFWEEFDRRLKQRQLKALVRPALSERIGRFGLRAGGWLAPAAAAVALFALWPDSTGTDGGVPVRTVESEHSAEKGVVQQLPDAVGGIPSLFNQMPGEFAQSGQNRDRLFVFDAIVPDSQHQEAPRSFRTVSHPETLHASGEPSADYVLNIYESGVSERFEDSASLEF